MPRGRLAELTIERVIWKRHRMDVIRALARKPDGMRYTEIQYEVVRGSATDVILRELIQVGLAEWRADLYFITPAGKKVASVGDVVAELGTRGQANVGSTKR